MELKGQFADLAKRMPEPPTILAGVYKVAEQLERDKAPKTRCETKAPPAEPPNKMLRTGSDSPPGQTPGVSLMREKAFQGGRDWAGALKFSGVPLTFSSTFRLV